MSDNKVSAPIEHFLWMKESQGKAKLVYYDSEGNQFEKVIPQDLLETTLSFFDGKKRAISRSSGGLTLAEPYQLVVYEKEREDQAIKLGIRVRFIDLKRDAQNAVISSEGMLHTKVVALSELREEFTIEPYSALPYLLECGNGLIPIRVFRVSVDSEGREYSHFIVENEMEHIAAKEKGSNHALQRFIVLSEAIRLATVTKEGRTPEILVAKENTEWKLRTGEQIVPPCLANGTPMLIPTGITPEMTQHLLHVSSDPEEEVNIEPLLLRIKEEKSELIPFGLLERS